jgi:hypothetical protein
VTPRSGHCFTSVWSQSAADILDRVREILSRDPTAHARACGALEGFVASLVPLTVVERSCCECRAVLGVELWEGSRALAGEVATMTHGICDRCFDLRASRPETCNGCGAVISGDGYRTRDGRIYCSDAHRRAAHKAREREIAERIGDETRRYLLPMSEQEQLAKAAADSMNAAIEREISSESARGEN